MSRVFLNGNTGKIYQTLGTSGYTGSISDRLYNWLRDNGYSGAVEDMLNTWLSEVVDDNGSTPDLLRRYLEDDLGYSGSIPDMLKMASEDETLVNPNLLKTVRNSFFRTKNNEFFILKL